MLELSYDLTHRVNRSSRRPGYFGDVFDVVLFSVVRTQRLKDRGSSRGGSSELLNATLPLAYHVTRRGSAVHIMTGVLTLIALLGVRTIRESFGIHLAFVEVREGQRSHGQSVNAQPNESDLKQASGW